MQTVALEPFSVAEEGGQLRVRGELDLAAVPELRACVSATVLRDGRAVLDLSGIEFVDVAGLSALTALAHEAQQGGWLLDMRHASLAVRQLARLTGLQDLALAA
jgi:anti-anti-sigma factor